MNSGSLDTRLSVPPPNVLDALDAPDAVAGFAFDHEPRADALPALLAAAGAHGLSDAGQADALAALDKYKSLIEAAQLALMADMAARDSSGKEYVREEIAASLRISPMSARSRLEFARTLHARFPDTAQLLADGRTTVLHARVLVDATNRLADDADARRVESMVLPKAQEQTVGKFRTTVEKAVLKVDAATAEDRHAMAVKDRQVAFRGVADGMAEMYAYLPLDQAAAAKVHIDALAAATDPRDGRTSDQRRADVLCELLTGVGSTDDTALPSRYGLRPSIQVVASVETLAGASDEPGEVVGFGAIPAWLARHVAADPTGTWHRIVTDPFGRLLDYGRSTYPPPADLARFVIARDRICQFPGCPRTARRCDLDHRIGWTDGGTTSPGNMHALCPRHHQMKTETGWRYEPLPNGDLVWKSTSGRTYRTRAPAYEMVVDNDPDPPF